MKKKKFSMAALLLSLTLAATMITGCGNKNTGENTAPGATTAPTDAPGSTEPDSTPEAEGNIEDAEKIDISIAALKGPTAIGMIQLMENAENGQTANNYQFTIAGAADEITASIVKGEIQIAAVPCNLASVLYNRTEGAIQIAAINTSSVLYIVETGDTIHSIEDLRGKTIYSTGKGTTPEYTLNYLLRSAGLDPENDVTIEFKSEAAEVAAMLAESENAVAMLPQPYVTVAMTQNETLRIALDVAEEWEKYSEDGSSVVTGVVIVNKAFAEENKEAVAAFLAEYAASAEYVNANVEEAAQLVEKFDIVKAAVAVKAIPYCNVVFIEGEEMKTQVSGYLSVLFEQDPSSVGGTLPSDDFYY